MNIKDRRELQEITMEDTGCGESKWLIALTRFIVSSELGDGSGDTNDAANNSQYTTKEPTHSASGRGRDKRGVPACKRCRA